MISAGQGVASERSPPRVTTVPSSEVRATMAPVAAPWPAEIIEWLVEDGDPVSEGQPLVRIQPQGNLGE